MKTKMTASLNLGRPLATFFLIGLVYYFYLQSDTLKDPKTFYPIFLKQAIEIVLITCLGTTFNRSFNFFFWDGFARKSFGGKPPRLLQTISSIFILYLTVSLIVWYVFEGSVSSFWTASSTIGIILGVALKNLILDVFTGVASNVDQAYKIGDIIQVHQKSPSKNDFRGIVKEINWRTTRIKSKAGNMIIIPNGVMAESSITNFVRPNGLGRFSISYFIDSWIDPDRIERVLYSGIDSLISTNEISSKKALSLIHI